MASKKDDLPFSYQRGNLELTGRTEIDRKNMRLDTILYWTCRIIIALALLASIILKAIA